MKLRKVFISFFILIVLTYTVPFFVVMIADVFSNSSLVENPGDEVYNYDTDFLVPVFVSDSNKIVDIPLDEYVVGVVAAEMPASYGIEALKAQAIAARTYVLKYLNSSDRICDTEMCQVFISHEQMKEKWNADYSYWYNKIRKAVLDTKNEVIFYDDELIEAMYFASSSGHTYNSEDAPNRNYDYKPYLRFVDVVWDIGKELQGHGVGMSQHAAGKMAEEGFLYKEILEHFYTNITIGRIEK